MEQRRGGFGGAIFVIVVAALIGYLAFAALQGEYGLFRLFQTEAEARGLETELESLRAERAALGDKTRRLSTGSVDLELLDEQARRVLGLGRPDELIIR
ncbi:MAG: septum formation initiator precursor [Rhodovulum sulfidophilum]|uniref:Septum formation initiator n=1 Tax=Rhodovulum sulfidophilum TaxID=35806 RepID=A0A2W5NEY1_RHOSU|nr:MAG: septum formation initiator precursor [Rhodovulum sulfidophilum]